MGAPALPRAHEGNPLKGKSASSFQHTLKPEDACPGSPISDRPLTVPQVGVSEVEGPDEACEGVPLLTVPRSCAARRQLHVLQAGPLCPAAPLLHLGSGWTWPEGGQRPSLPQGASDCSTLPSRGGLARTAWPATIRLVSRTGGVTLRCYRDFCSHLGTQRHREAELTAPRSLSYGELMAEAGMAGPGLTSPGGSAASAPAGHPAAADPTEGLDEGLLQGLHAGQRALQAEAGHWGAACTWGPGVGTQAVTL